MLAPRLPVVAFLLALAAGSNHAVAQTSLRLNWTPAGGPTKTCVYTTDANGVSMDPTTGALLANGSFASTDCPAVSVVIPDPVITNGIDSSDIPSATVTGASHTISWAATADSCTYAGSTLPAAIANWPTTGNACSDAASCAAAHNIPITIPGTVGDYTFRLTCSKVGAANTAVSTRTVTVTADTGGGDTCVNTSGLSRHTFGTVAYNSGASRETDMTLFESVFGFNPDGPSRLFPGTSNLNQRVYIPRNKYVALKFTVPANFPAGTYGQFRFEETQPQAARMSFTISKTCGDFSTTPTPPLTQKCIMDNNAINGTLLWGYNTGGNLCALELGQTYYLNIIHAPLTNIGSSHCSGTCGNTIQNQKMGGSGWPVNALDDE